MEHYKIFFGNEQVGQAQFTREGLYYAIKCSCKLPDCQLYGIAAQCDNGTVYLGTCYPERTGFLLQTRKPIKHFPGKVVRLDATLKSTGRTDLVTVVKESAPVLFLERIERVKIGNHNGSLGFIIQANV